MILLLILSLVFRKNKGIIIQQMKIKFQIILASFLLAIIGNIRLQSSGDLKMYKGRDIKSQAMHKGSGSVSEFH